MTSAAVRKVGTRPTAWATTPHSSEPAPCDAAKTTLNVDRPRARTHCGRNTCSDPLTLISTESHAMPAGSNKTASTPRLETNTQAASDTANTRVDITSIRLID